MIFLLRVPHRCIPVWRQPLCRPAFIRLPSTCRTASTVVPHTRPSWVERLPPKMRPYLYLTRIDKPIGTLLLFYPCGTPKSRVFQQQNLIHASLVDFNGRLRAAHAVRRPVDIHKPIRRRRVGDERSGLHYQRHVGPKSGQGCWCACLLCSRRET